MGRLKNFLFTKKLKASSLMEVVVATSILLVVFAIALFTLNNIMMSSVHKDTHKMEVELEKLMYQYKNKQIKIPVSYKEEDQLVSVQKIHKESHDFLVFTIVNTINNKMVTKNLYFYEIE